MPRLLDPAEGIIVFTDGSASSRDRTGGWAWVALDAYDGIQEDSGSSPDTTISRMELMACAEALSTLEIACAGPCDVLIQTDSQYVQLGFTDKQRARNSNVDLWDHLETMAEMHSSVVMEHVRGHQGHQWNERADQLAGEARKHLVKSLSA